MKAITQLPPLQNRMVYYRDLVYELVIRDMKVRYKHSILGFTWSLLNPLFQVLVFYLIFGIVLGNNLDQYVSFLFVGTLVYAWVQSSLSQGVYSIIDNGELVKRPGFPSTILPIVTILTNLIHFILSLPVLFVFLVLDGATFNLSLLFIPVLLLIQFILILGIAYIVASINVVFRDMAYLLGIFLNLFFFISPIFYNTEQIPANYLKLYSLNPLVAILTAYRDVFMRGQLPNLETLIWPTILAIILLINGYAIFVRMKDGFVEEM